MTRKPPPHRRKANPLNRAQLAPRVIQPGPSPMKAEMEQVCSCHSDGSLYGSLRNCPKCGHRSYDRGVGCERRSCGYSPPEWSVRHVGIGVLAYDTEDEARTAAGTAGTLLHWGQEVGP